MEELDAARIDLEEANESGDFEDRLELSQRVSDLEDQLQRERLKDIGE
jgi:hypothetical protein